MRLEQGCTGKYELFKTCLLYDATAKYPHWL
jgi:hypothetical protein